MENSGNSERLFYRRLVILIFVAFGIGTKAIGQAVPVIEVQNKKIIAGQNYDIVVKTSTLWGLWSVVALTGVPEATYVIREARPEPYISDAPENLGRTLTAYRITMRTNRAGKLVFPPVSVASAEDRTETNPLTYYVLSYDEIDYDYPLSVRWRMLPKEIRIGETFPLVLEFVNLPSIESPASYPALIVENAVTEAVTFGEIVEHSIDTKSLYNVPIKTWMLTPNTAGRILIPSVTVTINDIRRSTASFFLDVIPLPEQMGSNVAVGDYETTYDISAEKPLIGEDIQLVISVKGSGNMKFFAMPTPRHRGLTLINEAQEESLEPVGDGYQGERRKTFTFVAQREGTVQINIPSFRFFSPEKGIREIAEKTYNLIVSSALREETSILESPLLSPRKIRTLEKRTLFYKDKRNLVFFLPPLFFFIIMLSPLKPGLKKRFPFIMLASFLISCGKNTPQKSLISAENNVISGRIAEASEKYAQLIEDYPNSPGVLYNHSIILIREKNYIDSLHHLHKALRLLPGESLFRKSIINLEEYLDLPKSPLPSSIFSPFLLLVSSLIASYCAACLVFLSLHFKIKWVRTLGMVIAYFSITLLLLSIIQPFTESRRGIVSYPEKPFYKVPDTHATESGILQPGTSVKILMDIKDYCLIVTRDNIRGWIKKADLLFLGERDGFWRSTRRVGKEQEDPDNKK